MGRNQKKIAKVIKIGNERESKEHSLGHNLHDKYIGFLQNTIRFAVKVLSLLMTVVILWGVFDVAYVLYTRLTQPPRFILNLSDILVIFGAFLGVLIAIEIFINIILYLRDDVIHVKLVLATALMAAARKAIVLDINHISANYFFGIASLILALGIAYWLISRKPRE